MLQPLYSDNLTKHLIYISLPPLKMKHYVVTQIIFYVDAPYIVYAVFTVDNQPIDSMV